MQTEHVAFPRLGLGSHAGSPPRPAAVNFSLAGCSEDIRRQREQPCWAGVPAPWRSVEAGALTSQSFSSYSEASPKLMKPTAQRKGW